MANRTDAKISRCATCQFWTGERKIVANGRLVETPLNEYTKCNVGKGNHLGHVHGLGCKAYKRWVELP